MPLCDHNAPIDKDEACVLYKGQLAIATLDKASSSQRGFSQFNPFFFTTLYIFISQNKKNKE